jgi:hypothetical protein
MHGRRRRRGRAKGVLKATGIVCGVVLIVPFALVAAVVVGVPYLCVEAGKKTCRSVSAKFGHHDWKKNYEQLHRKTH